MPAAPVPVLVGAGIMNGFGHVITSSDRTRLQKMCESHTKNEGW
jgi:phosphotransferase system  glucose/maltose/N-acetylglucosamine-specific IIC component